MRNLGLTVAAALACICATKASAAELEVANAAAAEATADPLDSSAYGLAGATASSLAVQPTNSGGNGWEFAVTPYLWAAGTKADIDTLEGEEIEVDQSFGDILGDLKFAFMGAFEARNGRFVTVHDIIYLSLGSSADGNLGPIPLEADADMKLFSSTHLLGYRLVDEGPMFLDLLGGVRVSSVNIDLELSGPLQTFERGSKKTEVGPVIASRFRAPLGERWGFAIYGDIGGLGVSADLSWQLLATVQYDISDHWRLSGGWRHFSARQDKNDFEVDVDLDGPIIGFTYRF